MHTDRPSLKALKTRIYTVKRFLPLALLRLKTCLPDFEAIRTRKPWVLFLLVFVLLVKVFFISKTPKSYRVMRKSQSHLFVKAKLAGSCKLSYGSRPSCFSLAIIWLIAGMASTAALSPSMMASCRLVKSLAPMCPTFGLITTSAFLK